MPVKAERSVRGRGVVPSTAAEDLGTVIVTCWLLAGAALDARAHASVTLETFFTPWHAALYSGFAATLAWITFIAIRRRTDGRSIFAGAPPGYEAAWIGLAMFAVGGVGDLAWHEVFGIEQDIEATFSPTHLLLSVGAILVIASPLRAAIRSRTTKAPPSAIASATLVVTITCLVLTWLSPLVFLDAAAYGLERGGIASLLIWNAVVVAPALALLSRWRPSPGWLTVLLTVPALAVVLANTPSHLPLVGAFAGAGFIADVLVHLARVSPDRPQTLRVFGTLLPALVWGAYFGVLGRWRALGWDVELWAGSIVLSSLSGVVMAHVLALRTAHTRERR